MIKKMVLNSAFVAATLMPMSWLSAPSDAKYGARKTSVKHSSTAVM